MGDGAFNMVNQAVATAVEYALPAIWVVLNNYELGIERKGMERGYNRTHPWCHFIRKDTGTSLEIVAWVNLSLFNRLGEFFLER